MPRPKTPRPLRAPRRLASAGLAACLLLPCLASAPRAQVGDIVFLTQAKDNVPARLFTVDTETLDAVRLIPPFHPAGRVGDFDVGPRARTLLITASEPFNGFDLYRINVKNGDIAVVSSPSQGIIRDFRVGPRGKVGAYRTEIAGVRTLHTVKLSSTKVSTVQAPELDDADVFQWSLGDRGKSVFFLAGEGALGVNELYRAKAKKGVAEKIELPLEPGHTVASYRVGPKERFVIATTGESAAGPFHLHLVDLKSGERTELAGPFEQGFAGQAGFSDKGRDLVFLADLDGSGVLQLHHRDLKNGETRVVNGPLPEGGGVNWFTTDWGRRRVVYVADEDTAGVPELYVADLKKQTVVKANGPLGDGGEVDAFRHHLDSKTGVVHYLAKADADAPWELYRSDTKKGGLLKLSEPMVSGGEVTQFTVGKPKDPVQYLADQEQDGRPELYLVDPKTLEVRKVNGPLTIGGSVLRGELLPKGAGAVYQAAQDTTTTIELYHRDFDTGAVTKLNDPVPVPGAGVSKFRVVGR